MCRWLLFKSNNKVGLADLVLRSENSLVKQSYDATYHPGFTCENNANFNADGFGVGWYFDDTRPPAILRSITPAWSDPNLREICKATYSNCILGHVRAATPGTSVTIYNCHPFRHGRLLFQHNGHLEGFQRLKRKVRAMLPDHLYSWIDGSTDTEHIFAIFLSHLKDCCAISFTIDELRTAMHKAISQLVRLVREEGVTTGYSTFNIAVTDGRHVIATRFCDKYPVVQPPSLYYSYVEHSELVKGLSRCDSYAFEHTPGDGSDHKGAHDSAPAVVGVNASGQSAAGGVQFGSASSLGKRGSGGSPPEKPGDDTGKKSKSGKEGACPPAVPQQPIACPISPSVLGTQHILRRKSSGQEEVVFSPTEHAILIASEPLQHQGGIWCQMPANMMLSIAENGTPQIENIQVDHEPPTSRFVSAPSSLPPLPEANISALLQTVAADFGDTEGGVEAAPATS